MQANTDELPLRGNYFAEAVYLEQNLAAGTLQNRAAARMAASSRSSDSVSSVLDVLCAFASAVKNTSRFM